MTTKLTHYVEHLSLVRLCFLQKPDYVPEGPQIERRDISLVALPENYKDGAHPYAGFRFFDRYEAVTPDREVLIGKARNVSEIHYVGTPVSIEDALKDQNIGEHERTFLEKSVGSTNRCVLLSNGQYYPVFDVNTKIVSIDLLRKD